ncbi:MAG: tautomerase family protein [Rubrivivax sp.]|nr:tautomerase family protein [Rubrivivax sp.]
MPTVHVQLFKGRTADQKRAAAAAITEAVVATLGGNAASVQVIFQRPVWWPGWRCAQPVTSWRRSVRWTTRWTGCAAVRCRRCRRPSSIPSCTAIR